MESSSDTARPPGGPRIRGGKLPPEILERLVLRRTGVRDPDVIVPPRYGEDASVIRIGGSLIAVHSDPITAASRDAGWLSINVAANDVASKGALPRWASVVILIPEDSEESLLDAITAQIDRAARELGISVVGGHTEAVPGLRRPIIVATVIGKLVNGPVTSGGARPGDLVILSKSAGLEGTAIIARDYGRALARRDIPWEVIERASRFMELISVVKEAVALARKGIPTTMHDPTEGGVLGGVTEVAYSSGVEIEVYEGLVPFEDETLRISGAVGIDPLRLISSGALLATVPGERAEEAVETLRSVGVKASVVGKVVGRGGGARLVKRGGESLSIPRRVEDEIYRVCEILGPPSY